MQLAYGLLSYEDWIIICSHEWDLAADSNGENIGKHSLHGKLHSSAFAELLLTQLQAATNAAMVDLEVKAVFLNVASTCFA
jgi:hypothetical protein